MILITVQLDEMERAPLGTLCLAAVTYGVVARSSFFDVRLFAKEFRVTGVDNASAVCTSINYVVLSGAIQSPLMLLFEARFHDPDLR